MPENRWWVLSDDHLRVLLERAHGGEHPDLLLLEEYANAEHNTERE